LSTLFATIITFVYIYDWYTRGYNPEFLEAFAPLFLSGMVKRFVAALWEKWLVWNGGFWGLEGGCLRHDNSAIDLKAEGCEISGKRVWS
jgi:hypothetical protein